MEMDFPSAARGSRYATMIADIQAVPNLADNILVKTAPGSKYPLRLRPFHVNMGRDVSRALTACSAPGLDLYQTLGGNYVCKSNPNLKGTLIAADGQRVSQNIRSAPRIATYAAYIVPKRQAAARAYRLRNPPARRSSTRGIAAFLNEYGRNESLA